MFSVIQLSLHYKHLFIANFFGRSGNTRWNYIYVRHCASSQNHRLLDMAEPWRNHASSWPVIRVLTYLTTAVANRWVALEPSKPPELCLCVCFPMPVFRCVCLWSICNSRAVYHLMRRSLHSHLVFPSWDVIVCADDIFFLSKTLSCYLKYFHIVVPAPVDFNLQMYYFYHSLPMTKKG